MNSGNCLKLRDWISPDRLDLDHLLWNPNAISYVEQRFHVETELKDHHWLILSVNPSAIHLLERFPQKINWHFLNQNPSAGHLLEQNPHLIYWDYISHNPSAIHIMPFNLLRKTFQKMNR